MPDVDYRPPPSVVAPERLSGSWTVDFIGEDGRTKTFSFTGLPLPGWHPVLAAAFENLVGPAGTRRTLCSAVTAWSWMRRLLLFLAELTNPPTVPQHLTASQVDAFVRRIRGTSPTAHRRAVETLRALHRHEPLHEHVAPAVLDYLDQRIRKVPQLSTTGYSDGEFTRLVTAARADVAAIRDRIDAGEQLLSTWSTDPSAVEISATAVAAQLAVMAESGVIPRIPSYRAVIERRGRTALAQTLFVTQTDREPLLVLLAAVTGRNSETPKELPAEHRVLDGRAVELQVVKRRHGPNRWYDTVTWEIGPPHRQLHTPGGLYLLLHRLMARGRAFSGSHTLWSTWRNGVHTGLAQIDEHHDPFARNLSAGVVVSRWGRRHELRADPTRADEIGEPLSVELRRIRTTVEVRRTRAVGGHLPSAVQSNTMAVLFANYLRGDATAQAWAEEVLGEAVADAEAAALAVHRQTLSVSGHSVLPLHDAQPAGERSVEGAWNRCADPQQHPTTGRACRQVSFLDCFHCGNCLITRSHLPAILALLDSLAERRTLLGEGDWWQRYGTVWAAIRSDILPKFTPAEVTEASDMKPQRPLLQLAEDPWERP